MFVAGSIVATPMIAGSSPTPVFKTDLTTALPDLTCVVNAQVDFGVVSGHLSGIYMGGHRQCTSPNGQFTQYGSWLDTAVPVTVTGCPQTAFTGSANITWLNRNTLQTEPGTAAYDINLATKTLSIKITSGPLKGDSATAVMAIAPTGAISCPGSSLVGARTVLIDGSATFTHP